MASAMQRTCLLTQQLVIKLRTHRPVVTNVSHVYTDLGSTTAVITRTYIHITAFFILMTRTVVDTIATDVHRQAEVLV